MGALRLFNTPYEKVNIRTLHLEKDDETSCTFNDEKEEYTFNKSKSVLLKKFVVPKEYKDISVEYINDPLALLEELLSSKKDKIFSENNLLKGYDYVFLPLYSYTKTKGYFVPEKSGLNQFNAGGRKRNDLEVYIPVPKMIHKKYPNFFPSRDTCFTLLLPDGKKLSAKICQDGGKALMSNPNKDLGDWLLRKVLKKKTWEIVTMEDLYILGVNSVCIENMHQMDEKGNNVYKIFFSNLNEDYQSFISDSI